MKNSAACVGFLFLIFCAGWVNAERYSDEDIEGFLLGTWCEDPKLIGVCTGYMVFSKGGVYKAYGLLGDYNMRHHATGVFTIENGIGCITPVERYFTSASTGDVLDFEMEKFTACSLVTYISEDKLKYRWLTHDGVSEIETTMKKVSVRERLDLPEYIDIESARGTAAE